MMLAIVTAISGSGRKEYLKEFETYAKKLGKRVKIYYLGEMLFEQAAKTNINITKENILNTNPHTLAALRAAVFEKILGELPENQKKYDAILLSVHSFFYWRRAFHRAYDRFYLAQSNPEVYFTLIGNEKTIKKELDGRKQWQRERLTIREISLWQNVEVETTASWADIMKKPFYVFATGQPLGTLYKLLFMPHLEPVYISMPMTHLGGDKKRIEEWAKKLEEYFVVFDPRTHEIGPTQFYGRSDTTVSNQTVKRDLHWLIHESKKIIALFPKVVASPGVINELREAHETNKEVWLIYPEKQGSPFISYYYDRIFRNEKEFFAFLRKEYKGIKKFTEP